MQGMFLQESDAVSRRHGRYMDLNQHQFPTDEHNCVG